MLVQFRLKLPAAGKNLSELRQANVAHIYHVVPTHYLPLILRDGVLRSKESLLQAGYNESHFRSTSHRQDRERGFGNVVHCTTAPNPPILTAKLARGFPHVRFAFPIDTVPADHEISRFNIARGRYLRSGNSPLPENARNGRYHGAYELPVARTAEERAALLRAADVHRDMLEVLIPNHFPLPDTAQVQCFSEWDINLVRTVLNQVSSNLETVEDRTGHTYPIHEVFRSQVAAFVENALADPDWKGNGLDFDRLR